MKVKKPNPKEAAVVVEAPKFKNWNKVTPSVINLRAGKFATVSDLVDVIAYSKSLPEGQTFGVAIDDRTFEDVSPEMQSQLLDLAMGLGCEYLHVKGITRPERFVKLMHLENLYAHGH